MSRSSLWRACVLLGKQVHDAEAAGIGVDDPGAIIEGQHHVIMGAIALFRAGLEIEFAEIARRSRVAGKTVKRPVIPRCTSRQSPELERGQDIFGAARQVADALPRQALGKAVRKRKAQAVAAQRHGLDGAALEHGFQSAHDRFDFWKFWHGET